VFIISFSVGIFCCLVVILGSPVGIFRGLPGLLGVNVSQLLLGTRRKFSPIKGSLMRKLTDATQCFWPLCISLLKRLGDLAGNRWCGWGLDRGGATFAIEALHCLASLITRKNHRYACGGVRSGLT